MDPISCFVFSLFFLAKSQKANKQEGIREGKVDCTRSISKRGERGLTEREQGQGDEKLRGQRTKSTILFCFLFFSFFLFVGWLECGDESEKNEKKRRKRQQKLVQTTQRQHKVHHHRKDLLLLLCSSVSLLLFRNSLPLSWPRTLEEPPTEVKNRGEWNPSRRDRKRKKLKTKPLIFTTRMTRTSHLMNSSRKNGKHRTFISFDSFVSEVPPS